MSLNRVYYFLHPVNVQCLFWLYIELNDQLTWPKRPPFTSPPSSPPMKTSYFMWICYLLTSFEIFPSIKKRRWVLLCIFLGVFSFRKAATKPISICVYIYHTVPYHTTPSRRFWWCRLGSTSCMCGCIAVFLLSTHIFQDNEKREVTRLVHFCVWCLMDYVSCRAEGKMAPRPWQSTPTPTP